jgi:hypothetical protein
LGINSESAPSAARRLNRRLKVAAEHCLGPGDVCRLFFRGFNRRGLAAKVNAADGAIDGDKVVAWFYLNWRDNDAIY